MIDNKVMTFITLAQLKSYTKTAEALNMTQPSVSQHIKYLEEHFQVELVKRDSKNVYLTSEGESFLKGCLKLSACYDDLKSLMKDKKVEKVNLNIGVSRSIAENILPNILKIFHKQHPQVICSVFVNNSFEILDRLNKQEIDIAFIEGPFNKKMYDYKLMKTDKLVLISSPDHPLRNISSITLNHILKESFISREIGSAERIIFENALLAKGVNIRDLNIQFEVNSIRFIKRLVMSNLGVAIIAEERVRKEVENNLLTSYIIRDLKLSQEFNIVYLKENKNHKYILTIMHISKKFLEEYEAV